MHLHLALHHILQFESTETTAMGVAEVRKQLSKCQLYEVPRRGLTLFLDPFFQRLKKSNHCYTLSLNYLENI